MTHHALLQYGARPVHFDGSSLVSAEDDSVAQALHCELEVYQKASGGYVARLLLSSLDGAEDAPRGPSDHMQFVTEAVDEDEIVQFFRKFPVADFILPAPGPVEDASDVSALHQSLEAFEASVAATTSAYRSFVENTFPDAPETKTLDNAGLHSPSGA